MSRDDSILYSGITSAEPRVTPRQKQREETEQARIKLKPAAQVVIDEIAKEREAVVDLRSFIVGESEEAVRDELRARKLYLGYLNTLEAKFKQIMKPKRGSSE